MSGCQLDLLFESKADVLNLQVALRVVNVDDSLANFMRFKSVLLKGSGHSGDSLAHAAPCGDVVLISMNDILLEIIAHLSKDKNLLVRHQDLGMTIDQGGLDSVLYLALWLCPGMMIDELETRGEPGRHDEREGNRVVTNVQHWHGEDENWALISENVLLMFALNLNSPRLLAAINLMVSGLSFHEAQLFDSLHIDHDLLRFTRVGASDRNASCDLLSRVIHLCVGLHNHIAHIAVTAGIDVTHILLCFI